MANQGPTSRPTVETSLREVPRAEAKRLLGDLLRGVSRSFYLTLRVLPAGLRQPVGLAYLLARAADTIADTRLLAPSQRLDHLLRFREQVKGPADLPELHQIGLALKNEQPLAWERELLASLPEIFSVLETTGEPDRSYIRSVVVTLSQGMERDLNTFPAEDDGRIAALQDSAALDCYIYYVAGCVGEFWTQITMAHTPRLKGWNVEGMKELGVGFGKALQLTNVLRDVPKDLRIGRCYLPQDRLASFGITPEELLEPSAGTSTRPLLVEGIETALGHFSAAEEYLLAIPRLCLRLRLAVLWPVLIGLATLAMLARNEHWLDPARQSKVDRAWVYRMMALSCSSASSDKVIQTWIRRLRRRVEDALE